MCPEKLVSCKVMETSARAVLSHNCRFPFNQKTIALCCTCVAMFKLFDKSDTLLVIVLTPVFINTIFKWPHPVVTAHIILVLSSSQAQETALN